MKLSGFEALAAALEASGVRYLVAGGLAVAAHGYLRFTKDVDIVIRLIPDNIEKMFAALASPLTEKLTIRFVSLATLIRMKEEANRPQDRADIEQLLARGSVSNRPATFPPTNTTSLQRSPMASATTSKVFAVRIVTPHGTTSEGLS